MVGVDVGLVVVGFFVDGFCVVLEVVATVVVVIPTSVTV